MDKLKNYLLNQDISEIKKTLKIKIFDYFYAMLDNKHETSFFTLYTFYFIETIQLISFAFSSPHKLVWKIPEKTNNILINVLSGFRLTPLLQYTSQVIASTIVLTIFVLTLSFFILLIIQITLRKENSSFFSKMITMTHFSIPSITILFFIPFNELFLTVLNCRGNKLHESPEEVKCYQGVHLLLAMTAIIGLILYLIITFLLSYFYYYPFINQKSTIRLTSTIDVKLLLIKFIFVIQAIFVKVEYISIAILLILSIFLLYSQMKQPIYSAHNLELFLNLRNVLILWTYFNLLIARMTYSSKMSSIIYLLISGYPLVIYAFIMFFNDKNNKFSYDNKSINNVNVCIAQLRLLIELIDSFLGENKVNLKDDSAQKNDIILKGIIKMHTKTCLKEECPLSKFIQNKGNYNIQKQCLLNYMAIFFNNSIKRFPNNILIRMQFIQFNYDKKYNLNGVRNLFESIKKMKIDLNSQFTLYCQEKEISKMKVKDINDGNGEEKEKLVLDQNYKKLKNYIDNSTKLYVEFWGIFAANITNNLNTQKLYKLGEKLNFYLDEIKHLWENNLQNKKLDIDNENIAQLYSRFLREILWDQKKSDAVLKKINEEHNLQSYDRVSEENKNQFENIDNLENQDYLIFFNANEKGKTSIIQYSNSLTYLIGYQKSELINKPFEILLPSLLSQGYSKQVEECIKYFTAQKSADKDSFKGEGKNKKFILIKSKMGYIIPFNIRYFIYDNNDFSNNFLIKAKLEAKDVKSSYPFYLLAKPDFSLESISSSAINLGLSMDLLKKYVIRLNVLIRTNNDDNLNLYEKYKDYEEEAQKVTWVEPSFIYPKDDNSKLKDISIQDLIKKSNKAKFYLQIFQMKYCESEIIGFALKLFEKSSNKKKEKASKMFIPNLKNQIIFDLLNLNYIRTTIVKEKSGFRNLRENAEDQEKKNSNLVLSKRSQKIKLKSHESNIIGESSEDEKVEVVITKDKLFELQTKDSNGIKSFINLLPFYGNEISLIKHRPNKEQYPAGKAQVPQIKIDANKYTNLIEAKIKENPKLYKKIKNLQKDKKVSNIEGLTVKQDINTNEIKQDVDDKLYVENINKDFSGNASVSLVNVINISSINLVKFVDFLIYFFVIVIIVIQFILTYRFFNKNDNRYLYFTYSYRLLNDISYIKYFISEGIFTNEVPNYNLLEDNKTEYLVNIKLALSDYREDLANLIYQFNNPKETLPQEYNDYISNTNLTIISSTAKEQQPFSSAQNKLTTSIFYVSTSEKDDFNMENPYAYELMVNLLNSYYSAYEKIITFMSDFFEKGTKDIKLNNCIIFGISFVVSLVYLIVFYRMMMKLDKDREKPLNLFLTIKNKIFEDLKNSAENFSNKLLNKLFRDDENEEESQRNYSKINIKANDINIAKFKALNEYKATKNKESSFFSYFIQLVVFYGIFDIIVFFEFLNTNHYYDNIKDFIKIYNYTYFSEIFLVSKIDIIKQYLYNDSIENYGSFEEEIDNRLLFEFVFMAAAYEPTIKETSKTNSFLKDQYKDLFKKYLYSDFSELIKDELKYKINATDIYLKSSINISNVVVDGFQGAIFRIFELLRLMQINYFMNPERNLTNGISELILNNKWKRVDALLLALIRPWYNQIIELIESYYKTYSSNKLTQYIILFVLLLVIISIYYWIGWKRFEDKFIDSIQKSFDLINLIPEEIKNIIINKLNENN